MLESLRCRSYSIYFKVVKFDQTGADFEVCCVELLKGRICKTNGSTA